MMESSQTQTEAVKGGLNLSTQTQIIVKYDKSIDCQFEEKSDTEELNTLLNEKDLAIKRLNKDSKQFEMAMQMYEAEASE